MFLRSIDGRCIEVIPTAYFIDDREIDPVVVTGCQQQFFLLPSR